MFDFLKFWKKSAFPSKKMYEFRYHHICQGDYCSHNCLAYDWIEAVNSLLGKEANKNIYIDNAIITDL